MSNIISRLDAEGLIEILSRDEDFNRDDVEIIKAESEDDNDALLLTIGEELKICFNFLDDSDLIVMTLSFGNLEEMGADLEVVNAFNLESVNAAAFVDDEGDLILRSSLCLRGGVSEDCINELIENFSDDIDTLSDILGGEDDDCEDEE